MEVRLISIDEAYSLVLHPTSRKIETTIETNRDTTNRIILFKGDIVQADKMYCDGTLYPDVVKFYQRIFSKPTPEKYKEGLARQYKICEKKTHSKGFAFWNEYKKRKKEPNNKKLSIKGW